VVNSTLPHPHCSRLPSPSRFVHGKSSNTTSRRYLSLPPPPLINYRAYLIPYRSQTSHAAAKKAALPIRFVIVGGGAAGLACAVALRRVGHHVILLEKDSNFVGVSILTLRLPSCLSLSQASIRRGVRMPPNMTKIFNYWGMSSKVADIGIVAERIIMSRCTRCYLLIAASSSLSSISLPPPHPPPRTSRVRVPARYPQLGI
jgi:hypothetical protein